MRKIFLFLLMFALILALPSCTTASPLFGGYEAESEENSAVSDKTSTVVFSHNRYIFTGDSKAIASNGGEFYILKGGDYKLSGKLRDVNIVIDAEDERVRLILCGIEISSDSEPPLVVKSASEIIIETEEKSENIIECRKTGLTAILSQVDIKIVNKGSLSVSGMSFGENKS